LIHRKPKGLLHCNARPDGFCLRRGRDAGWDKCRDTSSGLPFQR
jgi:hypothetical protein